MVDLNPFPCACQALGQKGLYIPSGKTKLSCSRSGHPDSDASIGDASEHPLVDEIRRKTSHVSGYDTWDLKEHGIENCFMALVERTGCHGLYRLLFSFIAANKSNT